MILTITIVDGLEHEFYDFPYIGNVIFPTDEVPYFSEGWRKNHQPAITRIFRWGYKPANITGHHPVGVSKFIFLNK